MSKKNSPKDTPLTIGLDIGYGAVKAVTQEIDPMHVVPGIGKIPATTAPGVG